MIFLRKWMLGKKTHVKTVDLEISDRCNANCVFCPRDKGPERGFMKDETFKKAVLRILEVNPTPKVVLCGLGEPMMHPNFLDYCKYLHSKKIRFKTTTNAFFLTPKIFEELVNYGIEEIDISASDIGKDYEKIHNLGWERVKKNIDYIAKNNNGRCKISISIVICKYNKDNLENLKKFWNKKGINNLRFWINNNRGGAIEKNYYFTKDDYFLEKTMKLFERKKIPFCSISSHLIFISADGRYHPCCHDFEKKYPLGNVFENSIKEIIVKSGRLVTPKCGLCKRCDNNPVNLFREIKYRKMNGIEISEEIYKLFENSLRLEDRSKLSVGNRKL